MTPFAIGLILIQTVLHVLRDFLTKKSKDKQIFIWWFVLVSLAMTTPVIIYLIAKNGMPDKTGTLIAACISILHFLYWLSYTKAYDGGDLSHIYPIIRSSPAFILIFAMIFLDEKVSILGVTGILFVTIGVYLINVKKNIFEPIRDISKEKYLQWAFFALLIVTTYSLIDKVAMRYIDPIIYAFILTFFAEFFFGIYIFKTKNRAEIFAMWQKEKKIIVFNGLIAALSYPLLLMAVAMSKVSYVAGIRQISAIFAVLLGGHFLQEKHKAIRMMAAVVIVTGAALISVG